MQYEIILIALTAFGGLMLSIPIYLNGKKAQMNETRLTKIEKELSEWGKEIEKE